MPSAGFIPMNPAIKLPHTCTLDSTTTGIGFTIKLPQFGLRINKIETG
jgi:hypothetical protein